MDQSVQLHKAEWQHIHLDAFLRLQEKLLKLLFKISSKISAAQSTKLYRRGKN